MFYKKKIDYNNSFKISLFTKFIIIIIIIITNYNSVTLGGSNLYTSTE